MCIRDRNIEIGISLMDDGGNDAKGNKKRSTINDALVAANMSEFIKSDEKQVRDGTAVTPGIGGAGQGPSYNATYNSINNYYYYNTQYPYYNYYNYAQQNAYAGYSAMGQGQSVPNTNVAFGAQRTPYSVGMMNPMTVGNTYSTNSLYSAFNQPLLARQGPTPSPNSTKPAALAKETRRVTGEQDLMKDDDWPQELKNFVKRAYGKCQSSADFDTMDNLLRSLIYKSKSRGEIHTKDWKNMPLPTLPHEANIASLSRIDPNRNQSGQANTHGAKPGPARGFSSIPPYPPKPPALPGLNQFSASSKPAPPPPPPLNSARSLLNKRHHEPETVVAEIKGKKGVKRVVKKGKQDGSSLLPVTGNGHDVKKVTQRFSRFGPGGRQETTSNIPSVSRKLYNININDNDDIDFEELAEKWKVIGTCKTLEKSYLRLTEQPDPATVRPEPVLREAMKALLKKWKDGKAEYHFVSDQFRAMRQDLVVQHIKNDLTVKIYEHNARISLECHDFGQFNQCLNQLHALYRDGIKGHFYEFIGYRMMSLIFSNNKYQFSKQLEELAKVDFEAPEISFALDLKSCLSLGNVTRIFKMYKTGPNLTPYVFDLFILKLRVWALAIISKAYGDKIELEYISELLAFNEQADCKKFIIETGGSLSEDETCLMLRSSAQNYREHELFPKFS
eukprot:TRINITY_DN1434_c0_g3_i1.p1 TRINITY_DN1434_c0_g3~~TRINITY_DN1434_c0_g3_i1.p1  ORF type:complete len:673 (+),score=92.70 TRINITY_DN1434_c0_g3_i1:64-2082(+)